MHSNEVNKKIIKWIDSTQQIVDAQRKQIDELERMIYLIMEYMPFDAKLKILKEKLKDDAPCERQVAKVH